MKPCSGFLIIVLSLLGACSSSAKADNLDVVTIKHVDYFGVPFLAVDTDDIFLGVDGVAKILRGVKVCNLLGYAKEVISSEVEIRWRRSTVWDIHDSVAASVEREARRHGFPPNESKIVPYGVFSSITCRRKAPDAFTQMDDGNRKEKLGAAPVVGDVVRHVPAESYTMAR
jgi:hypothetical protein